MNILTLRSFLGAVTTGAAEAKGAGSRLWALNQNQVGMVDGAGNVSGYGNQTALRAEDFEQIRNRRESGRSAPARPESLGKFKRVAVPHRGFLAAPHHQFRTIGEKRFHPDDAGSNIVLLGGFLQVFERDRAAQGELRHRRAPQAGQMRSAP
jgi:hypothetical protein